MRIVLTLTIMMALAGSVGATDQPYYWGPSGQVPLKIDSTRVLVKLDHRMPSPQMSDVIAAIPELIDTVFEVRKQGGFVVCAVTDSSDYDDLLVTLRSRNDVYLAEPYYLNMSDSAMILGDALTVAFDSSMTPGEVEAFADAHNIAVDRTLLGMENVYVLRNTDSSGYGLLDLANSLYTSTETRWSHPDFCCRIV
ncbi:MAG: hypothetical protein KKA42_13265 [candidate division Zixibacteria bacterium]|nr:hypothetical protein [candidate division Zixibacteria bacterium]